MARTEYFSIPSFLYNEFLNFARIYDTPSTCIDARVSEKLTDMCEKQIIRKRKNTELHHLLLRLWIIVNFQSEKKKIGLQSLLHFA